jgi:cytidyltransferase-like protein
MQNALNMTTNEVEKYMREQVRMDQFYTFSFTRDYIEVVGEVCGVTSTYRIHPDGRLEWRDRQKHKYGLFLGRFQPFHDGHGSIVMDAWNDCEHLVIAIGSSQEERTKRNPLSFAERAALIRALTWYNKDITIIGIPDRENPSDDSSWGEYVMNYVEKECGKRPTVIFEGGEAVRSHWYDTLGAEVKITDREDYPISATEIRQMLLEDDRREFALHMPMGTWGFYDDLRRIMLEVYGDEKVSS